MKNTLKQRIYKCECGVLTKEYFWDSEIDKAKVKCSDCSKLLTKNNLVVPNKNEAASIRTPTKNR